MTSQHSLGNLYSILIVIRLRSGEGGCRFVICIPPIYFMKFKQCTLRSYLVETSYFPFFSFFSFLIFYFVENTFYDYLILYIGSLGFIFNVPLLRCLRDIQCNTCVHCFLCVDDRIWEFLILLHKERF